MESNQRYRYPGIYSFSAQDQASFFGRDEEIDKLLTLIEVEDQVLLYAKSGIGKTSLINAGVIPKLDNRYLPIRIRFKAYIRKGQNMTPVANVVSQLYNKFGKNNSTKSAFLDEIDEEGNELWFAFKRLQIEHGSDKIFVLFFDQFEELFSYPNPYVVEFKNQLYEALKVDIPGPVMRQMSRKIERKEQIATDTLQKLDMPIQVKPIYSIRTNRLALLDRLVDKLKHIRENFLELQPLDREGARGAILQPAEIPQAEGGYVSVPFTYSEGAINTILNFLSEGGAKPIETTQLQIICEQIEKSLIIEANNSSVKDGDLPDFKDIFLNFYKKSIGTLNEDKRQKASELVEENLIRGAQRISLDEVICQDFLDQTSLDRLVETRLLRREKNNTGNLSYELAHDTLIDPILVVAEERRKKEKEARLKEQQKAELERVRKEEETKRKEQERQEELRRAEAKAELERRDSQKARGDLRRTQKMLTGVLIALIVAAVLGWLAFDAQKNAKVQTARAEDQRRKAEEAQKESQLQAQNAQIARQAAEFASEEARLAKEEAEENARRAIRAQQDAEYAKQLAQNNERIARSAQLEADSLRTIQERLTQLEAQKALVASFNARDAEFKGLQSKAEAYAIQSKSETDIIRKAQQARTAFLLYRSALDSLKNLHGTSQTQNYSTWYAQDILESMHESYQSISTNELNSEDGWTSQLLEDNDCGYSTVSDHPAINQVITLFEKLKRAPNQNEDLSKPISLAVIKALSSHQVNDGVILAVSGNVVAFSREQDRFYIWHRNSLEQSQPEPVIISHNQNIYNVILTSTGDSLLYDDCGKINLVHLNYDRLNEELEYELSIRKQMGIIELEEWNKDLKEFQALRTEILEL